MTLSIIPGARLPTKHGAFTLVGFEGFADGQDHVALVCGDITEKQGVLTRIHSECLTGDVFGSRRCDCGDQLETALEKIAAHGAGVVIYLRQEGRGIGLNNKLRAYALQDQGMDTVEANHALGFADDLRDFTPAVQILKALQVPSVQLLTNNPRKVDALVAGGIEAVRVPLLSCVSVDNAAYLQTKALKLGHLIPDSKNRAAS